MNENAPSSYRIMRLFVFFDMPVKTKDERKEYVKFRDYLMDDGFLMLQYSVYTRMCPNDSSVDRHIAKIMKFKPKYGNIRILQVTEKQFITMTMVHGEKTEQEEIDKSEDVTVI